MTARLPKSYGAQAGARRIAPMPWLIALAPRGSLARFEAFGWEPWPADAGEAEDGVLMRRKVRQDEEWRALAAEIATLTTPARVRAGGAAP